MIALDLFAGTGWGVACQKLGIEEYGVEIMPEAVATRTANGMHTIYRDVWDGLDPYLTGLDVTAYAVLDRYDTLIASPPCQTFSMAGGGAGRRALDEVLALIDSKAYRDSFALRAFGETHDPRTALVLTPLAHVYRDVPTYVVFEQVPPVLPVWGRCAEEMRAWGYSAWTGNLQAEMYGTIVTCPMHESTASNVVRALRASPEDLATAARAGTGLSEWLRSATYAADLDRFVRERASVESARSAKRGTTGDEASVRAAWDAALISRAVLEDAPDATWLAHVKPLLSLALAATRTLPGRAGGMSMSEATFGFESTEYIGESIESLPSRLWAALCDLAKSYTTSTRRPTTTTPGTSPSSAAMPTIADTIESVIGKASCGVCDDHGVPQTRKRAVLIARADGIEAAPPTPTHSRYYSRDPKRLDPGVLPWVSIAEALGWGLTERPFVTAGNAVGRAEGIGGSGGKAVITGAKERGAWATLRSNYGTGGDASNRGEREGGEPAPTVTSKADRNKWHHERPATTVSGDPRIAAAGHHVRQMNNAERVTIDEAAALQSYPPGFTFSGTKTKQFLQVGNAVPPLLAEAILRGFLL